MSAFVLVVQLEIKPKSVDDFMPLALANAEASRTTEPGCRQFDVLVDPKDPTRVMFYEVYDDGAAFDAHQQTPHFKRYLDLGLRHLASRTRNVYARLAPETTS